METVSTGVLDKNKEQYLRSKEKAKKKIWYIKTYAIVYVKIQKKEDLQCIMSDLQPNCCLKVDFQKFQYNFPRKMDVFKFIGYFLEPITKLLISIHGTLYQYGLT